MKRPFTHDNGHCWAANLTGIQTASDDLGYPTRSNVVLFENDHKYGIPHALHDNIRRLGRGYYSHWNGMLLFSTSDNSDPNSNGRSYTIQIIDHQDPWACDNAWNSISVSLEGKVSICCNNHAIIGDLTKTRIDDIWHQNAVLSKIRGFFAQGTYRNAGCELSCPRLVMRYSDMHPYIKVPSHLNYSFESPPIGTDDDAGNLYTAPTSYDDNIYINDLEYHGRNCNTASFPFQAMVIINDKCNLRCPMCPQRMTSGILACDGDLSVAAMNNFIPAYRYLRLLNIVGGGEIFIDPPDKSLLSRILTDVNEYANLDHLRLVLYSNGILMSNAWADHIFASNVVTTIAISIDSVDPEIYQKLRTGASLDQLRRRLDNFMEVRARRNLKRPKLRFSTVLSDFTYKGLLELQEFITKYDPEGLDLQLYKAAGYQWFTDEHNIFCRERAEDLVQLRKVLGYINVPSSKDQIIAVIDMILSGI